MTGTDTTWVAFQIGAERLALPSAAVDRILPRPPVVKLPGSGAKLPSVNGAVSIGNEIIPLLSRGPGGGAEVLVLRLPDGKIALEIDRVLSVGSIGAEDHCVGQKVQRLAPDSFHLRAPPREAPAAAPRSRRAHTQSVHRTTPAVRVLEFSAGDRVWSLNAAEIVSIEEAATWSPVPLGPSRLLGAAVLRGRALPVLSLAGGTAIGPLVVARGSRGTVSFAVDRILGWSTQEASLARATCVLRPDDLQAEAGLLPSPDLAPAGPPPVAAAREREAFLPVTVGGLQYGLPMAMADRVLPIQAVARLPVRGAGSHIHGAFAVDGRVVPYVDARRWLGVQAAEGAGRSVVLLRLNDGLYALRVDSVGHPFSCDKQDISSLQDPAGRLAAAVKCAGSALPILNVAGLSAEQPVAPGIAVGATEEAA